MGELAPRCLLLLTLNAIMVGIPHVPTSPTDPNTFSAMKQCVLWSELVSTTAMRSARRFVFPSDICYR